MPATESAAQIVRAYHDAWTAGDVARARTYLADNLDFQGPIDRFTGADQFAQALTALAGLLIRVELLEEYSSGSGVALLYDCITAPLGPLRTAEFFQVEQGKIVRIRLVFDATELRKLMGR